MKSFHIKYAAAISPTKLSKMTINDNKNKSPSPSPLSNSDVWISSNWYQAGAMSSQEVWRTCDSSFPLIILSVYREQQKLQFSNYTN